MASIATGVNLENNASLTQGTKSYIQSVLAKTGGSLRNFTPKDFEIVVQTAWMTEAAFRKVMFRGRDPGPDSCCPMLTDKPKANPKLDPHGFKADLVDKRGMSFRNFTTSDYEEYVRMIWKTNTEMRKGAFYGVDPGPDSWIPEALLRQCVESSIEDDLAFEKALPKKTKKFDEKNWDGLLKKEVELDYHKQLASAEALAAILTQDEKDALVALAGRVGLTEDRAKDIFLQNVAKTGLDTANLKAAEIIAQNTQRSIDQECAKCKKSAKKVKLLVCSRCKIEHYCSRECQNASWPAHKRVCVLKTKGDKGDKKS
jgi:hypothetical protein